MKHVLLVAATAILTGCSSQPSPPATPPADKNAATITVTSKSPEAVAHFRKGEALLDNLRPAEAAVELEQALKLDPDFAQARALHGVATPGPNGLEEIASAAAAAASLPEAERLVIEAAGAGRRGDNAQCRTTLERLAEVAPADWRSHYLLGVQLVVDQRYQDGASALKKATGLNPNAGPAQNMLGYAALRQGDAESAIAPLQEYVRIQPGEPNPQDSLGEALVAAGRFKEGEAAFEKALALSPQFWNAHQGIAYARFYAGDWKGGREALARAKTAAQVPSDRITIDDNLTAAAVAQHDYRTAMQVVDGIEKMTGVDPSEIAFVPLRRAMILVDAGRDREALPHITAMLAKADGGQLPPGLDRALRNEALRTRITAEAAMRDAKAAAITAAALDQAAAAAREDPFAQSAMHFGHAMLAVAKGDAADARAQFDACSREDLVCKWQGVVAAEKAGDTAGAAAVRAELLKNYQRDPVALIVRSRLTPIKS